LVRRSGKAGVPHSFFRQARNYNPLLLEIRAHSLFLYISEHPFIEICILPYLSEPESGTEKTVQY
jgi:hypothetical protein